MSQYGAQGRAKAGKSTASILHFYYPKTTTGRRNGQVTVLITENIGGPTVVVARAGLQVHDLAKGTTTGVPQTGPAAKATRWRMDGNGSGGTTVSYRTPSGSAWHPWRTLKGNGEFRSTKAPLTLVLPQGQVTYRGTLRSMAPISRTTHRITVNKVSLENYVRGVVPREMPSTWKPAALRAQAVAARTYASFEVGQAYDHRFELGDSTSWQVYGGLTAERASTNAAAQATSGEVLLYQGAPAFTQFSSSNGGQLAPGSEPYLVGKPDSFDADAGKNPYSTWARTPTAARIAKLWPSLGRLTSIEVTGRDGSGKWGGRITSLTLHGTKASLAFPGGSRTLGDFAGPLGMLSTYADFSIPRARARGAR
jgi:peptidoglycan hydrolase-like amidase